MSQLDDTLDSHLEEWFAVLQSMPPRNQPAAIRGKENFLAQARSIAETVSKPDDLRHRRWIDSIRYFILKKEYSPMMATMTSIVLIISLLMGGAGVTVYAAQDSLPNQVLYKVKILSEDVATYLPLSDAEKLDQELNYITRRVDEITRMAAIGFNPPESVYNRLENHLDRVINLALNTKEQDMIRALMRIKERLQVQEETLNEASPAGPSILRAREAIRTRLRWTEFGLNDPNRFREEAGNQNRYNQPPEPSGGYGPGPGMNPDQEPGENGPHMMGTPTPGNGYGPGPDKDEQPPGYGPGPYATGTPTPGSGYGPGPGPDSCQTCTPGTGPGPNPDQGSPGGGQNQNQDPGNGSRHDGGP